MAEWQLGCIQVIPITIWSFILKNINIFYFEMSGQIAIQLFSIKKAQPNGNSAAHKSFGHSHSNSNANGI